MNLPYTNNLSQNNIFIRKYLFAVRTMKNLRDWLFPDQVQYPENESGELIRRALAHKSWFDEISSSWMGFSIWRKAAVVAGVVLGASLIGLFVGASIVFALSALCFMSGAHVLLVAHENHRVSTAELFATEAIELNKDLEACKQLLDQTVSTVEQVVIELNEHADSMRENAAQIEKESDVIFEYHDVLAEQVEDLTQTTGTLIVKEHEIQDALVQTETSIHDLNQAIEQSKIQVEGIGGAAEGFNEAVKGIQHSQILYAQAAARFGHFSEERREVPTRKSNRMSLEEIVALTAELRDDRVLLGVC